MYKDKRITVVVPAYNEQALIGETLKGVPEYVDHIVVVDDASKDETLVRAQKCAEADSRIEVQWHERNTGVGGTVVDGYRRAIENGSDIACVMAGDNQMPPEHLPELLDAIIERSYNAAKGNRFLASQQSLETMPRYRFFGNILLTILTKAASGYWSIFDTQNGYYAISTQTLRALDLSRVARRYDLENSRTTYSLLSFGTHFGAEWGVQFSHQRGLDVDRNPLFEVASVSGLYRWTEKWEFEGRQSFSLLEDQGLDTRFVVRRYGHDLVFEVESSVREGEGSSFGINVKPRFGYSPSRVGYVPW